MSECKRYDCTNNGYAYCQGCETMEEDSEGMYVKHDDYAKQAATIERLTAEGEKQIKRACRNAVDKLTEIDPDAGWDGGDDVAEMYIKDFRKSLEQTP